MVYRITMRKTVVDPSERAIRLGLLYDVLTQNAAAVTGQDESATATDQPQKANRHSHATSKHLTKQKQEVNYKQRKSAGTNEP